MMDSVFILIKFGVFFLNLRPYLFLTVGSRSDGRCFPAYLAHLPGQDRDAVSVLKDPAIAPPPRTRTPSPAHGGPGSNPGAIQFSFFLHQIGAPIPSYRLPCPPAECGTRPPPPPPGRAPSPAFARVPPAGSGRAPAGCWIRSPPPPPGRAPSPASACGLRPPPGCARPAASLRACIALSLSPET